MNNPASKESLVGVDIVSEIQKGQSLADTNQSTYSNGLGAAWAGWRDCHFSGAVCGLTLCCFAGSHLLLTLA